jgi:SM-20-related protein
MSQGIAYVSNDSNDATANMINLTAFQSAPLQHDPYDYVIVPGFIKSEVLNDVIRDFPQLNKAGSFPVSSLNYGASFASLLEELRSPELTAAVEEKFSVSLKDRPIMITARGKCRNTDGKIHTDSESKIISVLIYMNSQWDHPGGKLRVLRSNNINDMATEVPPISGTMLIFRRSNHSFHGHPPFEGQRQVIQLNWVTEQKYIDRETSRHGFSSMIKRLFGRSY